jgi:hypothetical protein
MINILLTDRQYFNIILSESNNEMTDEEKIKFDEFTIFTYTTIGLFERGTTKLYYFNNVVPISDEDIGKDKVKIIGVLGDFTFDRIDLKYDENKSSIRVNKNIFDKHYPDFMVVRQSEKVGITPQNIRKALEKAFPSNWKPEDEIFSAGLRGIYTIGSKLGDDVEDWSIMNYFDTKEEIQNILYLRYREDETNEDVVNWLSNLLRTDKEFAKILVDRQWQSIKSGLDLEREAVKFFFKKVNPKNVTFYPHGSKMDRWYGVDVTIGDKNFQIKPLSSYWSNENGYDISTYGMRDYKDKKLVDFLVFANSETVLIFKNKDYNVSSRNRVSFKEKPVRVIK